MIAVLINCFSIALGSLIGILFSKHIPQKITDSIQLACGGVTLVMGIQMAFKYQNVVYLALAMVLGGILGTALDIDGKVLKIGKALARIFKQESEDKVEESKIQTSGEINRGLTEFAEGKPKKNFAYAFLNSSVLFCVGAMAIVGSLKAGIEKDYSILLLKSVLDGFISIGIAVAMGVGTIFSAVSILLYQGALTALSVLLEPFVSEKLIAELTGSGGILVFFIGLNLMGIKKIKTANYIPAVLFSVIFVALEPIVISSIEKIHHFF
ncbi:DUF554 domain-containing protein [Treponema pectinovorum]|uniref:DUF554 domain-containing protein n=1 Tax=Treponema pectinovorum TaxID=164 RepID=UPI0011F0FF3B|nr:DUF554 domain-containing protein [Treponema pectinovorum]